MKTLLIITALLMGCASKGAPSLVSTETCDTDMSCTQLCWEMVERGELDKETQCEYWPTFGQE